jgi:ATP-dependent protease HslVU (ClpYQ) peptidase subunit
MTVVAWDGKCLAADRLYVRGNTKGEMNKVLKHKNSILGFAGAAQQMTSWYEWLKTGKEPNIEEWDLDVLCITKNKNKIIIDLYECSIIPTHIEGSRCAIGTGSDYALCAMYLGHSAVEAVDIASQLSPDCGNGIDILTFD